MSVLLEREIGKKALLMGNEALVRGAYEAGLDYASCYPGTPSSEVSNLLYELQGAGGFRMDFATNEKVAMEAVAGASMGGLNCLTAMKHVGLNVASDPLGTLTYLGVRGASWCTAPTGRACSPARTSRIIGSMPACSASCFGTRHRAGNEGYDRGCVRTFGVNGDARDGSGDHRSAQPRVVERRHPPKAGPRHYEKDYAFVPLPGNAVRHHKRLVERMRSLVPVSDASPFNRVEGPADTRLGVVASSAAVNYVLDAVKECGLSIPWACSASAWRGLCLKTPCWNSCAARIRCLCLRSWSRWLRKPSARWRRRTALP
ncbi:MAG: hypothetical protein ACLSHC_07455 [Bilophila wadsworthia]